MRGAKVPAEVILDRVSLEEVIARYTPYVSIVRGRIACPFHNGKDKNMRVDNGYYYCYVCHAKGDAISYTAQALHFTRSGAMRRLTEDFGLSDGFVKPSQQDIDRRAAQIAQERENEELLRQCRVMEENELCAFRRALNATFGEKADHIIQRIDELLESGTTFRANPVIARFEWLLFNEGEEYEPRIHPR